MHSYLCARAYICLRCSPFGSRAQAGPFPPPLAAHAAMPPARAKCALTPGLCEVLVKQHLTEEKAGTSSAALDEEEFTEEFSPFLASLAQHTLRVNASMVQKAVEAQFGAGRGADKFAAQVTKALRHCHTKGLQASSGRKLALGCKAVILSFKDERLNSLQEELKEASCGSLKRSSTGSSSGGKKSIKLSSTEEMESPDRGAGASAGDADIDPDNIAKLYHMTPPRGRRPASSSTAAAVAQMSPMSIGSSPALVVDNSPPPEKEAADASDLWYDFNERTAHRLRKSVQENGTLQPGPEGFCLACFGKEQIPTAVPNLVLEKSLAGLKKRPAKAAKKKSRRATTRTRRTMTERKRRRRRRRSRRLSPATKRSRRLSPATRRGRRLSPATHQLQRSTFRTCRRKLMEGLAS